MTHYFRNLIAAFGLTSALLLVSMPAMASPCGRSHRSTKVHRGHGGKSGAKRHGCVKRKSAAHKRAKHKRFASRNHGRISRHKRA